MNSLYSSSRIFHLSSYNRETQKLVYKSDKTYENEKDIKLTLNHVGAILVPTVMVGIRYFVNLFPVESKDGVAMYCYQILSDDGYYHIEASGGSVEEL